MSQFRQPTTVPGGRLERVHEDFERCYRAVQSKDTRFDGWFVTAVSTTRICCRPSCPARSPLAHNVVFYPTAAAAALGLPTTPATLAAHSQQWQPWRSYAVQYLWATQDHPINHWPINHWPAEEPPCP